MITPSAVALAARQLGVYSQAPRVLHNGYNLVIHLAPAPVVAKVMTLFAEDDAAYWRGVAAREMDVASHLRRHGVPVVSPAEGVAPGPHPVGDTCFTLWSLATPADGARPSPAEFAALLGAVEAGMASYPGELPALGAWRHTPRPASAPVWLQTAWQTLDARLAVLAPADLVPAHGDAHVGNLLRLGGGWLWCDFEDAARMPRYWDLACAVFRGPLLGENVAWAEEVRRLVLGAAAGPADQHAFGLALAVRTVQSVSGGLDLAEHGHPAGDTVERRLEAAHAFLAHLIPPR